MFPSWSWVLGLWIGAAIGSFLNVVIYRMPRALSISEPKNSFCPRCKTRLGALDMVPLLSWLVLGGKCRHCKAPISPRYFGVELLNGAIFGLLWWQFLVQSYDPLKAICLALFCSALLAAFFIDFEFYIIPDQINAFLLLPAAVWNVALYARGDASAQTWGIPSAVAGAAVGVGVFWGITLLGRLLLGKDAMGHGDIKMARGIGAMLFPLLAVASFGLAVILGLVFGLVQIAFRRGEDGASDEAHEEAYAPEPVGSILKSGLGYLLCVDVLGLFVPKVYEWWFGENPYAVESVEEEEQDVGATMIPFGPYLALGAIVAVLMAKPITGFLLAYWRYATGEAIR